MRLAVVRLTAMGDIIHTMVALQFLKGRFPQLNITWFVEEKFAEVLRHNPHVDRIVPLNLHALKGRPSYKLLQANYRKVRASGPFERIIDVQGLIKSALVAKAAGGPVAGPDWHSAKEKPASLFYRDRYTIPCEEIAPLRFASLMAKALGTTIDKEALLHKKPYLFYDAERVPQRVKEAFVGDRPNVLFVVGASNASKTYPAESFAQVADGLCDCNVLLCHGSDQERRAAEEIARASGARLLPTMDLNALKFAVARCDLLIGNDTGPSHMAWALNRPSIVLFGATPPSMMMQTPRNIAITSDKTVTGCRFDKSDRSIAGIAPDKVVRAARELLA